LALHRFNDEVKEVSTARKQTKTKAQKASSNGTAATKRPHRPKQEAPQLSEKAKKLALKAFQMTYDAHHGKSS
jgi:hypothetical protein